MSGEGIQLSAKYSRDNIDLLITSFWTILTAVVIGVGAAVPTAIRVLIGAPFILFVPGYVIVAALFPEDVPSDGEYLTPERIVLSILVSIASVMAVGFLADKSPVGITLLSSFIGLTVVIGFGTVLTVVRRTRASGSNQFRQAGIYQRFQQAVFPSSYAGFGLNVILVLSLVLASVAVAGHVTQDRTQYTETYLLTRTDSGDLVANDYPTTVSDGESRSLVFGLTNHEVQQTRYTVLVELQSIQETNGSYEVLKERNLASFSVRVKSGETVYRPQTLEFTHLGEEHRLVYLVYEGEPPSNPTIKNADKELHLWINVTSAGGPSTASESPSFTTSATGGEKP